MNTKSKEDQYNAYLNNGGTMTLSEWEQDGRFDPGHDKDQTYAELLEENRQLKKQNEALLMIGEDYTELLNFKTKIHEQWMPIVEWAEEKHITRPDITFHVQLLKFLEALNEEAITEAYKKITL